MSSPWKQLERRLPPLPGYASQSVFLGHFSDIWTADHNSESSVEKQGTDVTARPQSTRPFRESGPAIAHSPRRPFTSAAAMSGVLTTPLEIKRYLKDNRWLVEEYVRENCQEEDVLKWFSKKDQSCDGEGGLQRAKSKRRPSSFREGNLLCPSVEEDVKGFLVDMVEKLEDQENIPDVLYHLTKNISAAVKADEVFLFMVGAQDDSLYMCSEVENSLQLIPFAPVVPGTIVAAHVAFSLRPVFSQDILGDERFPQGTGRDGSLAKSVLCLPLIQPNGEIVAVIELSRHIDSAPFTDTERKIASTYFTWVGVALDKVQVCNGLMKQREFSDFLLEVSRVIFDDIVSIDTLSKHIMMFAKSLVNADRCALFMVDREKQELYADLFDDGTDDEGNNIYVKRNQIRIPMDKGIAGHVARTGEVVLVTDAYKDSRFNREVDVVTGYETRNILCMPIISHGAVIGVVQLINKMGLDGQSMAFDISDEANFKMFSSYCALALYYSKIYSENQRCEQKLAVSKEQLTYYTSCTEQQVERLVDSWHSKTFVIPPEFESFEFHSRPYVSSLCELFIYMVQRLFGLIKFDVTTLATFILTVRKNYRLVPFHNFCHAFDVTHCMFMLLLRSDGMFSEEEMVACFFACICHDLDHRAITNSFHQKFGTPLGCLYPTSTMERHHFQVTMDIISREGHDVLENFSDESVKEIKTLMEELILATDLALFFKNHQELAKLIVAHSLDWDNRKHRNNVLDIMMSTSDLCGTTKLWPVQCDIVDCLYDEFYKQGDVEKERGFSPIPMLDRDNLPFLPKEQVGFLSNICIPCFSTLVEILPASAPLLSGCKDNLVQWQLQVEGKSTTMWNVEASRVNPS